MCDAHNEKWNWIGIELPNEKVIRTLGEKENYKYLAMLEVDIIKQARMNEKN